MAPFNFLGFAAPERRRREGLVAVLGINTLKGVTSAGDKAVLEAFRAPASGFAGLVTLFTFTVSLSIGVWKEIQQKP